MTTPNVWPSVDVRKKHLEMNLQGSMCHDDLCRLLDHKVPEKPDGNHTETAGNELPQWIADEGTDFCRTLSCLLLQETTYDEVENLLVTTIGNNAVRHQYAQEIVRSQQSLADMLKRHIAGGGSKKVRPRKRNSKTELVA